MKTTLVNTPLKLTGLLKKLDSYEGHIGFDTEVAGPLLRGQDFVNITYAALLGVSLAFEDEDCFYLPVRHKGSNISFSGLAQVMQQVQKRALGRTVWAHNAQFDHQVMCQAGYPLDGLMCSRVAAWLSSGHSNGHGLKELAERILHRVSPPFDPGIGHKTGQEVLEYACHDALNTLQLGLHYYPEIPDGEIMGVTYPDCDEKEAAARLWFYRECDFALLLGEMKLQGIRIDTEGLARIREEGNEELTTLSARWDKLAPFISITSAAQLQQLFEEGTWVEHGRTQTGAFSTGKEAIAHQLSHGRGDGPDLARIRIDYQAINKVVTTYTDGLIEEAQQWKDKKLHPDMWHFGTVTGRLSSSNPNIQNQPAHGEWAKKIRSCFIPDPGMEFTSADYSQVELRYFANYCKGNLLQAFVDGKDLHQVTADKLGVSRDVGKTVNFGFLLYGGGPKKMAGLLGIGTQEARDKIALLHSGYPEIEEFREMVIDTVSNRLPRPFCRTLAGRLRDIPELRPLQWQREDPDLYGKAATSIQNRYGRMHDSRLNQSIRKKGERLVVNYLVQGGSRDLLVLGMNDLRKRINKVSYIYPSYSIITTVHDEVLIQHPAGCGDEARTLLKSCLEMAGPKLGLTVPIIAEPKTGRTWSDVK